jgi:hypothetical protein
MAGGISQMTGQGANTVGDHPSVAYGKRQGIFLAPEVREVPGSADLVIRREKAGHVSADVISAQVPTLQSNPPFHDERL